MEILKNRPIVLQFVNLERDKDDSFLSLIILRNNNRNIFIQENRKKKIIWKF